MVGWVLLALLVLSVIALVIFGWIIYKLIIGIINGGDKSSRANKISRR